VQNNFASFEGTARLDGIGWSFCYFGTTFEVVKVGPMALSRDFVIGEPYTGAYSEYLLFLNSTVESWTIDSSTAKTIADACPTVEAWMSTREAVNGVQYQYHLKAFNGVGRWRILYQDKSNFDADCNVEVNAVTGDIISATAR